MAKEKTNPNPGSNGKDTVSQEVTYPQYTLKKALEVPRVIWEKNAGNPFTLLDIAGFIQSERGKPYSPTTTSYRCLIRSSQRYGLTDGTWQNDVGKVKISLTKLGKSIVAPTTSDDSNQSMRTALQRPPIFDKFLKELDGRIIPPEHVCINTLIDKFKLSKEDATECYNVL